MILSVPKPVLVVHQLRFVVIVLLVLFTYYSSFTNGHKTNERGYKYRDNDHDVVLNNDHHQRGVAGEQQQEQQEQQEQHYHYHPSSTSLRGLFFRTGKKENNEPTIQRCGQRDPTNNEMLDAERVFREWEDSKVRTGIQTSVTKRIIKISTFAHIITNSTHGNKSDENIISQMEVLNKGFQNTGFSFILNGITRTENASWYGNENQNQLEIEMREKLHQGDASTLNLYFAGEFKQLLGRATFPIDYIKQPTYDGVILDTETIPNGTLVPYNEGDTAIHEVGHWMGLYHTFQSGLDNNGCKGRGDYLDDTPAELSAASGCPKRRNTCRYKPGDDPIHNYMDYTNDECLNEFTTGQIDRMQAFWNTYRSPDNASNSTRPTCSNFTTKKICEFNLCYWNSRTKVCKHDI